MSHTLTVNAAKKIIERSRDVSDADFKYGHCFMDTAIMFEDELGKDHPNSRDYNVPTSIGAPRNRYADYLVHDENDSRFITNERAFRVFQNWIDNDLEGDPDWSIK